MLHRTDLTDFQSTTDTMVAQFVARRKPNTGKCPSIVHTSQSPGQQRLHVTTAIQEVAKHTVCVLAILE